MEHQKKGLYEVIAGLEKEIAALKMDISERDESIGDKVRVANVPSFFPPCSLIS